jgi:hypothetical protein
MKVSTLITKLQQFHPDASVSEIDILRLFDDDPDARAAQQHAKAIKSKLAARDLDRLREYVEAKKDSDG